MIQDEVGGDLHLIQTADPYSTDFDQVTDVNHQEQNDGTRPELSSSIDVSDYDVIFIRATPSGPPTTPIPRVLTFLRMPICSGKTVIPFCTPRWLRRRQQLFRCGPGKPRRSSGGWDRH